MNTTFRRIGTLAFLILIAFATTAFDSTIQAAMYAVTFGDKTVEGIVVARVAGKTHLLGRDGRLWTIPDKKVTRSKKVSDRFTPFTVAEIRAQLLRELGNQFEVSGTKHYMVAHPRGQRDLWATRFEQLYRTFINYFAVRGFEVSEPPFPLIGIVCHDQGEFVKYSETNGISVSNGVLGYYSLESNRIIVFDVGDRNYWGEDRWELNNSTVLHEATHQVSYNTGICSRLSPPPLWVSEGMAMYFEAPGVFDSSQYPTRPDRLNRTRFDDYRRLIAVPSNQKAAEKLPRSLVLSDAAFRASPIVAYAESWALTFYLIETRPHQYANYLKRVSSNRPFQEAGQMVREVDFTSTFGGDWPMFVSRFQSFMSDQ